MPATIVRTCPLVVIGFLVFAAAGCGNAGPVVTDIHDTFVNDGIGDVHDAFANDGRGDIRDAFANDGLGDVGSNDTTVVVPELPDVRGVDINTPDAMTAFERILKSGFGEDSIGRLPDCDALASIGGNPDPGVNCTVWGLRSWGAAAGAAASVIVVADVADDITAYYDGHNEKYSCSYWTGYHYESYAVGERFIPVPFSPIEYWKDEHGQVAGAVFRGSCEDQFMIQNCGVNGEMWLVQPGLSLLLLTQDCCIETYRPGWMRLDKIYPIQDGLVYDWNGDALPLSDVKTILLGGDSPGDNPTDNPCLAPNSLDAGSLPDTFEDTQP